MKITDRDEVGKLWLPWCVERERPAVPIRIEREPERRDEARQLRVSDLSQEPVRMALSNYPREDGESVWTSIEYWSGVYSESTERVLVDEAKFYETPQGLMLHEGSHRTCGLYLSGIMDFEIRIAGVDFLAWAAYEPAELRGHE